MCMSFNIPFSLRKEGVHKTADPAELVRGLCPSVLKSPERTARTVIPLMMVIII